MHESKKMENRRFNFILIGYFGTFVASLFFAPAVFLCVVVAIVGLLTLDTSQIFSFLLFAFPTAPLLKYSSGTSYFTIIEIVAIFIICYKRRRISGIFAILLTVLLFEMLFTFEDWKEILKIVNIMLLYYLFAANCSDFNIEICEHSFINSMILTSLLGVFKSSIPRMLSFYSDLNYNWIGSRLVLRFSGIFSDPNYYSVALLFGIAVALQKMLSVNGMHEKQYWIVSFAFMTICGFATISKTFFIMYVIVVALLVISGGYSHKFISAMLVLITVVAVLLFMPKSFLNNILYRFTSGDYDITTGRAMIWNNYLQEIKTSNRILLIGRGVGAGYLNGRPTHNMYLELLYYLGIFGSLSYLGCVLYITFSNSLRFKRKISNYIGFIIMGICYFVLNGMTGFELPFYLALSFVIYNNTNNIKKAKST